MWNPEEEPFPVRPNFKVTRSFANPFLYLLFLSHSLSPHFFLTLFLPLAPFNIHGVLMPPAAGCRLLAGCKNRAFPWLLAGLSHSWFPMSLFHLCLSSFFRYVFLLCYLSVCLYFLTIFLCHWYLILHSFVSASSSPPT